MTKLGMLVGVWCFSAVVIFAGQAPTAQSLVIDALAKAKAEHKNVLLDFHASWCPWCTRLDALYEDPKFAEKFKKSFVFVPITVVERPALKANTNEGWDSLMLQYRKHKDQDIPYVVILSPSGRQLTDSYEKYGSSLPNNAGFPQTPDEIDAYIKQIAVTARAFNARDRENLRAYFIAVREKGHGH